MAERVVGELLDHGSRLVGRDRGRGEVVGVVVVDLFARDPVVEGAGRGRVDVERRARRGESRRIRKQLVAGLLHFDRPVLRLRVERPGVVDVEGQAAVEVEGTIHVVDQTRRKPKDALADYFESLVPTA